jgi:5-formyltetrahydrofolate cyclo-ligase
MADATLKVPVEVSLTIDDTHYSQPARLPVDMLKSSPLRISLFFLRSSHLLQILPSQQFPCHLTRTMASSAPLEDGVRQQKQALRKEIRSKLNSLPPEKIKEESQKVWDRLFQLPQYQKAKSVGLFLSMPSGEIDTDPVLKHATEHGKQIYVPQVGKNFEQVEMELLKVVASPVKDGEAAFNSSSNDQIFHHSWPRNKWGIPEPPADMPLLPASPGEIDVLVVPGLAFDKNGNRLGQGKGYYDRFIARMMMLPPSSSDNDIKVAPLLLVAVGFDCQLVEFIPVHEYDRCMDIVLLPSQIVNVSKSQ